MKHKRWRKIILPLFFLGIVVVGYVLKARWVEAPENPGFLLQEKIIPTSTPDQIVSEPEIPNSLQLEVPFTPQAPTANWDLLHNEACEEASLIMAKAFFDSRLEKKLPTSYVESEIESLTQWQTEYLGYYLSITSEEFAQMAKEVYGLEAKIVEGFKEQEIKQALSENKLVVWAGDGRLLNNPNFREPGPKYHMLVITGYNEEGFITNDPGTRNGYNYAYSFETLLGGNGNYSHFTEQVNRLEKHIIILSKKDIGELKK